MCIYILNKGQRTAGFSRTKSIEMSGKLLCMSDSPQIEVQFAPCSHRAIKTFGHGKIGLRGSRLSCPCCASPFHIGKFWPMSF